VRVREMSYSPPGTVVFRESSTAYRPRIPGNGCSPKEQRCEGDIADRGFPIHGIHAANRFSPGQWAFPYADGLEFQKSPDVGPPLHPAPTQAMREAGIRVKASIPCPFAAGRQSGWW